VNVNGAINAFANDFCGGIPELDAQVMFPLMNGFLGHQQGTYNFLNVQSDGFCPCDQGVSYVNSTSGSRFFIDGGGSQAMTITWKNTARHYATTDAHEAHTHAEMAFAVDMDIAGVPAGQDVTVYYSYHVFGGGSTSHFIVDGEIDEDSILVDNDMWIDGVHEISTEFDYYTALPGWNIWNNSGSFNVTAGAPFNFSVDSDIWLWLETPGKGGGACPIDENDGIFRGFITFSVVPGIIVNPDSGTDQLLFSLDIGSDSGFEDFAVNGNEIFDPGDVYVRSTVPVPPSQGYLDDGNFMNLDLLPDMPAPSIPFHSGQPIQALSPVFFDLDGIDITDFSLFDLFNNGIQFPIDAWDSDCVHLASEFLISLEDDASFNHQELLPSLPTESSAATGIIYGNLAQRDEVLALSTDNLFPGLISLTPVLNEHGVHASLAPTPLSELEDDDIDALDLIRYDSNGWNACDFRYFGSDHEACGHHVTSGIPELNPGAVYQMIAGNQIVEVVNPSHLGLNAGLDLADFEFGFTPWIGGFAGNRLAIFFSVHSDDPATPDDESAGLDPRLIYYSFMTGFTLPWTSSPMASPIDGIALNREEIMPDLLSCTDTWFRDDDGDGFGQTASIIISCQPVAGYAAVDGDCNDQEPSMHPGAPGTFSGVDNNCNGVLDPDEQLCLITVFEDMDGDGWGGNTAFTLIGCTPPAGYVFSTGDCDDNNAIIYPGAPGTQQGLDNNCDGVISNTESLPCPGDFNGDGLVNTTDMLIFLGSYGCSGLCGPTDMNGDGFVNSTDLLILLGLYGTICP
jgi:hypothetical protein